MSEMLYGRKPFRQIDESKERLVCCVSCNAPRIQFVGIQGNCWNKKCSETTVNPLTDIQKAVFLTMMEYRNLIFDYQEGDGWSILTEEVDDAENVLIKKFFERKTSLTSGEDRL